MSRTHDVTISAFDLDRIESELAAVTKQRDRLAEALRKFEGCFDCYECVGTAEQALAAVKGGTQ
jgi:hypothetical protein